MIAWLGMYDMPPLRRANDTLWSLIRAGCGDGPEKLSRHSDPWSVWRDPDLLLAQTCGMPFRTSLHGHVTLVGTPDYNLQGCPPGYYRSVLVANADASGDTVDAFDGGVFAYNEALSQSGWAGPITYLTRRGVRFSRLVQTGAHAASVHTVAEGAADLAGIDALTWALLCEHDPVARRLRVVDQTDPTPGLPYITAAGRNPSPIAAAVRSAIVDLAPETRDLLHLRGLVDIPAAAYLGIPTPPSP